MAETATHTLPALDSQPQAGTHRLVFIDTARCIALFLTVFAHLYSVDSNVRLYIYAFHMPLFFLLSGFLHKDSPSDFLIVKTVRRLLVPFSFFLVLGYLFFVISSGSPRWDIVKGSVRGIILGKSILANDILWFLLALFLVKIIGNLFILYPRTSCIPTALLFVFFYLSKRNWLYLGSAFMAIPFYLAGHYGKKAILSVCKSRFRLLIAVFLLAASALLTSINGRVSMMATTYGNTGHGLLDIALFYVNALAGCLAILCIASAIPSSGRLTGVIARSGISIVGLQFIPVMLWIQFVGHDQPFLLSLSFTILILAVCVLFSTLVRKRAKWLLGGK